MASSLRLVLGHCIQLRAGLHTGEVELRGDDVGGIAIHVAARVMAAAGQGEILVSRTVRDLVAGSDVTLEEDLRRRDLTINAMAKDPETGELIDPFGGKEDLNKRILKHVSEAFAEDPVRILRVARFAARFGFRVADETMALMRRMVRSGEADYLVPERVWQEFSRGLAEPHPGVEVNVAILASGLVAIVVLLGDRSAWPARRAARSRNQIGGGR